METFMEVMALLIVSILAAMFMGCVYCIATVIADDSDEESKEKKTQEGAEK